MAFELPSLPYAFDALEPWIDEQTMRTHHGKHHATYVDNLNNAVAGTAFEDVEVTAILKKLYTVPDEIRAAVRNNGGGHANHTLFWETMGPNGGAPSGPLADAIAGAFGSLDDCKSSFNAAAMARFGSGWAWLVARLDGSLLIYSTPNQDGPYTQTGDTPLLGLDVWEHAYYLKYQNRRAEYVENWWNVVNWDVVAARYASAVG
ncbi:MAG: superoxide dismutase [Caldilineaceae bacterium]|nr:superoxide dismutase [Caldilineaceae bacterium]